MGLEGLMVISTAAVRSSSRSARESSHPSANTVLDASPLVNGLKWVQIT
jgi:hypothetical protein